MIRAAALGLALLAGTAAACPPPSGTLLFHSCWGAARAELLLLPEEAPVPWAGGRRGLVVTGAYTGRGTRPGGGAKPVGLFVDNGRVINPNLARMDGILILAPGDGPRLQHRRRVTFAGRRHRLSEPGARRAFARAAAAAGASVMQSHLLIVDGASDVAPRADAPRARRRLFFTDAHGWGVWQSRGALTLHAAARRIASALAPRMALNLDMGSHDYCWRYADDAARRCGLRGEGDTAGLSNLLSLTLR